MLAGKEVIIQGGAHTTDMQRSCRTGCESHPYSSVFHYKVCILDAKVIKKVDTQKNSPKFFSSEPTRSAQGAACLSKKLRSWGSESREIRLRDAIFHKSRPI
jgi:hypothetical protein